MLREICAGNGRPETSSGRLARPFIFPAYIGYSQSGNVYIYFRRAEETIETVTYIAMLRGAQLYLFGYRETGTIKRIERP